MIGLSDYQKAALDTITDHSSTNPITGKEIAKIIGLKDRSSGKEGADMRSIIHALRVKGYPICATGSGYWWPKVRDELQAYIESFQNRVNDQQEAVDGLRLGLPRIGAAKAQIMASAGPPVAYLMSTGVRLVPADKTTQFEALYPDAKKV